MEIQTINSALQLVLRILDTKAATEPRIETTPDKPAFVPAPISSPFPRATGESRGISSRVLADYYARLRDDKKLDMHSVTVIKDGAVVAEGDFGAYDRSVWHISYSECKSVVGLAIGMLVDEGKLDIDEKIIKLFAPDVPKLALLTLKDVTVRHLLTMTSCVSFNEAGSVTETDWVRCFLESPIRGELGKKFVYNSMNTYMLSALVCRITGGSLTDFLRPRLFDPLGITEVHWEKCPAGIEKGGWGLYMRPEDFAKIGQLVLNGGVWNGKRLISQEWLDAATSAQSFPPHSYGDYDYGYQIWVGRTHRSFLFSGMFGQNVLGFFDSGVLLVTTAGNDELFQSSTFFTHTHACLGKLFGSSLPEDSAARRELAQTLESIKWHPKAQKKLLGVLSAPSSPLPEECSALDGRVYFPDTLNAPSLGLLPLVTQALQNIYSKGLISLGFRKEGERFTLVVREADVVYSLPLGFTRPERMSLDFHGETHEIATTARFARDEDDRLVLIVRVSFIETASARHIRLYFDESLTSFDAKWAESPGYPFLQEGLDDQISDIKLHPLTDALLKGQTVEYALFRLRSSLMPEFSAAQEE